jgi:hypothetical protein
VPHALAKTRQQGIGFEMLRLDFFIGSVFMVVCCPEKTFFRLCTFRLWVICCAHPSLQGHGPLRDGEAQGKGILSIDTYTTLLVGYLIITVFVKALHIEWVLQKLVPKSGETCLPAMMNAILQEHALGENFITLDDSLENAGRIP